MQDFLKRKWIFFIVIITLLLLNFFTCSFLWEEPEENEQLTHHLET